MKPPTTASFPYSSRHNNSPVSCVSGCINLVRTSPPCYGLAGWVVSHHPTHPTGDTCDSTWHFQAGASSQPVVMGLAFVPGEKKVMTRHRAFNTPTDHVGSWHLLSNYTIEVLLDPVTNKPGTRKPQTTNGNTFSRRFPKIMLRIDKGGPGESRKRLDSCRTCSTDPPIKTQKKQE